MAGQHSVFINYRRDDTADATGRIYDRLVREFKAEAVFKDVDALPVGKEFGDHILKTLRDCRVFPAIIGPRWLDQHNEAGERRLDDPADWVRLELEHAAQVQDLQIVPVLTNSASMPNPADLPDSLRFIAGLNAAIVRRDPDFHNDMDRLIDALKQGALTGIVQVEAPTSGPGAATAHWQSLRQSFDVADLRRFAETFPGTSEALEARRRADFLQAEGEALARINWSQLNTAEEFLRDWPNSSREHDAVARLHFFLLARSCAFASTPRT